MLSPELDKRYGGMLFYLETFSLKGYRFAEFNLFSPVLKVILAFYQGKPQKSLLLVARPLTGGGGKGLATKKK